MPVKHMYIVHHSHTDVGYTDLQEKIIYNQCDYIRTVTQILAEAYRTDSAYKRFRWNCETYFCVEQFLKEATEEEKKNFFEGVRRGNIGLSASYFNFTDLVANDVLSDRIHEMCRIFSEHGIRVRTAMNADINGISMGQRDAYIDSGVEFLFTNIHTHHGMYPLYKNQTAYFWENEAGKKLLVFSGEHYNLGNFLGMVYSSDQIEGAQKHFGGSGISPQTLPVFRQNLLNLLADYEKEDYPYDFLVSSVSGILSDNAPPNPEILDLIDQYNAAYDDIQIEMVTLDQLYEKIRDKVADAPVYRGDLTDWWAHGVGSTPYAVKHYKDAVRNYHICRNIGGREAYPALMRTAEDNIMLYAEHTWGHSSTVSNPYDTMVQNLDIRKTGYASKAHEAASGALFRMEHDLGDKLRYYDINGRIKAVNPSPRAGKQPVSFYVEARYLRGRALVTVTDEATGTEFIPQLSEDPRGVRITFIDSFAAKEQKTYRFASSPLVQERVSSRRAYTGAEGIHDLVNPGYDPENYKIQQQLENDFYCIRYNVRDGVTSFYNKMLGIEMLGSGDAKFFTPLYERSKLIAHPCETRRLLGRNIRGVNAELFQAKLTDIRVLEIGAVFKTVELVFELEGTCHSSVILRMYNEIPRIDFTYKIGKTISEDIESIFMPIELKLPERSCWIDKSGVAMRPGIDQLPGTCMEYYITDTGVVYTGSGRSIFVNCYDAPLIYQGEMYHHEIRLCDNRPENNRREVYSWIMNNIWETNFKLNLAGFDEFRYSISMTDEKDPRRAAEAMESADLGIRCFIIE